MTDYSDVQYDEGMAEELGKFPVLKEGTMRFVVKKAVVGNGKEVLGKRCVGGNEQYKNDLMVGLTISPVDATGKPSTTTTNIELPVPMYNPKVTGHTLGTDRLKTCNKLCGRLARAIYKDFPWYARQDKERPGSYLTPNGETIDRTKYDAIRKEVDLAVGRSAANWVRNPTQLLNETFYAEVEHSEKNGKVFANVNTFSISSNPPEDAELVVSDFTA